MRVEAADAEGRKKLAGTMLRAPLSLASWRPEDDKSAFLAQAGYTLENAGRLMADFVTLYPDKT